jgi:hypothetical protein
MRIRILRAYVSGAVCPCMQPHALHCQLEETLSESSYKHTPSWCLPSFIQTSDLTERLTQKMPRSLDIVSLSHHP